MRARSSVEQGRTSRIRRPKIRVLRSAFALLWPGFSGPELAGACDVGNQGSGARSKNWPFELDCKEASLGRETSTCFYSWTRGPGLRHGLRERCTLRRQIVAGSCRVVREQKVLSGCRGVPAGRISWQLMRRLPRSWLQKRKKGARDWF